MVTKNGRQAIAAIQIRNDILTRKLSTTVHDWLHKVMATLMVGYIF